MSAEAAAYYPRDIRLGLRQRKVAGDTLSRESLSPLVMDEAETRAYWSTQVQNHRTLLSELNN